MAEQDQLAAQFEQERPRLQALAARMLGSVHEADDAVQEVWLRLMQVDHAVIENLPGWLTTVTSRICLDHLRARSTRSHPSIDRADARIEYVRAPDDPEREALLAESVGTAFLLLLDRLTPAERVAFVLHDSFAVPFEDIAVILDRTPSATRQLASRARRKMQVDQDDVVAPDAHALQLIDAFLTASRNGDMPALLSVLAPEVVVRADATAAAFGVDALVEGRERVAGFFNGRAAAAFLARIDGGAGALWMMHGAPRVAFTFTMNNGVIEAIDLIGDPTRLAAMTYELIHPPRS